MNTSVRYDEKATGWSRLRTHTNYDTTIGSDKDSLDNVGIGHGSRVILASCRRVILAMCVTPLNSFRLECQQTLAF